jgi:hypothetical protein
MASSVQGTIPDQTWGQNLPGYFKDAVKPFVHGASFLIPHENPAIPTIVTKSTVGMVNDRGYIDSQVLRTETIRSFIENPSSYVARLHPHDMNSGMGGIENLSNLYGFGHPTPLVNGEDFDDTLYWAKGETGRARKDPLSFGYAADVLGPNGAQLIQQMQDDVVRQQAKRQFRASAAQAAFEGPATRTAEVVEREYNEYLPAKEKYDKEKAAYKAKVEAEILKARTEGETLTEADFDPFDKEEPIDPRKVQAMENEDGMQEESYGASGAVRGGRTGPSSGIFDLTNAARRSTESALMNYVNGPIIQPTSTMYSNTLLTTNAGRYAQFNPRINEPDGVRGAFANGGTSWGGGIASQMQKATDAQARQFGGIKRELVKLNAETSQLRHQTGALMQRVIDNQRTDGNVNTAETQSQMGMSRFTSPVMQPDFNTPRVVRGAITEANAGFDSPEAQAEALITNVRRYPERERSAPVRLSPGQAYRRTRSARELQAERDSQSAGGFTQMAGSSSPY